MRFILFLQAFACGYCLCGAVNAAIRGEAWVVLCLVTLSVSNGAFYFSQQKRPDKQNGI